MFSSKQRIILVVDCAAWGIAPTCAAGLEAAENVGNIDGEELGRILDLNKVGRTILLIQITVCQF